MEHRRVGTVTLVFVWLAVLVATAGCATTTPFGDDSSGDTDSIETETPATESETATPELNGTDTPNTATESNTPQDESTAKETGDDAGSAGGSTDERPTTGPINDTGLPVDENRIYNQTRDLLGSDADAPTVTVRELNYRSGQTDRPFFDYMGLTNESQGSSSGAASAAVATGPDSVVVNEEITDRYGEESADRFGLILAHEFAHTIQLSEGWTRAEFVSKLDLRQTESMLLYRSLVEGGAVFTADQYADRAGVNWSQIARFDRQYRTAVAELVYAYAPYHHGGQYFDGVVDSGRELGSVYTDGLPDSTEEVLHPEYDDTEPSDVTVSADSNRDGWTRQAALDDRLGAMFVDVVLTAHTGEETASEASKGWGNDQLLGFETDSRSAFAWVTHWDSAKDADQFADGFNKTLPNRSDEDVGDVAVVRAGNRSVVVLAGPDEFRDAIAIDGENAAIDIVLQSAADDVVQSRATSRLTAVVVGTVGSV